MAVGIGGLGCKLAINSSRLLDCKCVLISNDEKDLDENHFSIFIVEIGKFIFSFIKFIRRKTDH